MHPPRRLERTQVRIWTLSVLLAGSAGALVAGGKLVGAGPYASAISIPWPILAILFYLTEVYVVHVQFRRDSESFSLSEIPVVLGLFFVDPAMLVVAHLLGAGTALVIKRRQSPVKLAFNLSHLGLDTAIAAVIFRALARPDGLLSTRELGAAFLATSVAIVVGVAAVIRVVTIAEGRMRPSTMARMLGFGLMGTLCNTSVALIAVTTIRSDSWASWLLTFPAVALIFAYRAYASQRVQHARLQEMTDAARAVQESRELEPATLTLLEHARSMFRAEMAEVITFPSDDRPALRTTLGPGDKQEILTPVTLNASEGVWARVSAEGEGILLPRPIPNGRLHDHYAAQGIRDAIVAPLRAEDRIIGVLVVANRLGDVSTFSENDLQVFEMLAYHASVSLENARLVSQLQDSLIRLTELNKMKDDFVATVSHELRTPLTSIQGSIKTISRMTDLDGDMQRQLLQVIDRQSERLRNLIEDLLLSSKIESHTFVPPSTIVHLPGLIERVIEPFQTQLRDRTLSIDIEPGLGAAFTDEETLHRVLTNLVDNALKYSPDASPITIAARCAETSIVLSVTDSGYGMPPDQHDAIFERFYQVDQSLTRRVGGAGLGLYICRRLAERIGAEIWLERSVPGEGSTFAVRVPAALRPVVEATTPIVTLS